MSTVLSGECGGKLLSIRAARDDDLPSIILLWQRNIKTANTAEDIAELYSHFKRYFFVAICEIDDNHCSGDAGLCVCDECDGHDEQHDEYDKREHEAGEIIGFVAGSVKYLDEPVGHISGIAVNAEYRRMGVGTALIETVGNAFKNDGFRRMTLEVRVSNIAARIFYAKLGFKRLYVEKRYYADGEDAIVCEKILAGNNAKGRAIV